MGAALPPAALLRQPAPDPARPPPRHRRPPAAARDRRDRPAARRRRQPARTARRSTWRPSGPASSRPWPRSPRSAGSSSTGSSRRRRAGSARRCATAATTSCTTSATATSRPTAKACCTSRAPTARHAAVDGTELANLLADQTSLRLVVLNSCEGARTTLTDPYAGVATTLVQLGVPAVVAMQFEISDEAAILFAEELYTNLIGRQDPIDAAVAEARKAIYIELGTIEWATPVLFMGDVDVELFRFEVAAAPLPPPPPLARRRTARPPATSPPTTEVVDDPAASAGRRVAGAAARGDEDRHRRRAPSWRCRSSSSSSASSSRRSVDPSDDAGAATAGDRSGDRSPTADGTPAAAAEPSRRAATADRAGDVRRDDRRADGVVEHPVTLTAGQIVYVAGSGECGSTVDYHLATPSGSQRRRRAVRVQRHRSGRGTGDRHLQRCVVEGLGGGTGPYSIEVAPVPADVTVAGDARPAGERGDHGRRVSTTCTRFTGDGRRRRLPAGRRPCGGGAAYRLLTPSGGQLGGAAVRVRRHRAAGAPGVGDVHDAGRELRRRHRRLRPRRPGGAARRDDGDRRRRHRHGRRSDRPASSTATRSRPRRGDVARASTAAGRARRASPTGC